MKGILKDKLDHVEMPVPEHVWTNVSAQIGSTTMVAASTSVWTVLKMVGIGAGLIAAVGTATWWGLQSEAPATPAVVTSSPEAKLEIAIPQDSKESSAEAIALPTVKSEAMPAPNVPLDSKNDAISNTGYKDSFEPQLTPTTPGNNAVASDRPTSNQHPFERPNRLSSPQVPAITALFSVQGTDKSQVQFEPYELSRGMTYHWDFGDGQESDEQAPAHVYEQTGNYYATLTVTNGQGTTVTSGQELTIERKGDLQVANIITPNGDGYNDVFDPAGLDEGVQIDYLLIMDLRGEKVFESTSHPQWDGRLASGEEAPNGVYIYLLRGTDKNNGIIEKSSKLTVKR